jgi:hypothetical protein
MYRKFDVTENLFCIVHFSMDLNTAVSLCFSCHLFLLVFTSRLRITDQLIILRVDVDKSLQHETLTCNIYRTVHFKCIKLYIVKILCITKPVISTTISVTEECNSSSIFSQITQKLIKFIEKSISIMTRNRCIIKKYCTTN